MIIEEEKLQYWVCKQKAEGWFGLGLKQRRMGHHKRHVGIKWFSLQRLIIDAYPCVHVCVVWSWGQG